MDTRLCLEIWANSAGGCSIVMPTISSSQLPAPKNWDEFEEICADLYSLEWSDPNVVRHGRKGQRQHGVDIFGQTKDSKLVGVQCKGKSRWPPKPLTTKAIDDEVEKALSFPQKLSEFIIVTTADDDATIQQHALKLTLQHQVQGLFGVRVFGWGELNRKITSHPTLITKHYGFVSNATLLSEFNAVY